MPESRLSAVDTGTRGRSKEAQFSKSLREVLSVWPAPANYNVGWANSGYLHFIRFPLRFVVPVALSQTSSLQYYADRFRTDPVVIIVRLLAGGPATCAIAAFDRDALD